MKQTKPNANTWTKREPQRYSKEWQDEYLAWYENWRRDHWNKTFREIRKRRKNR